MRLDNSFFLGKNKIGTSNESIKDAVDRLSKTVPVGYFPTPDEFSKTILFLSSKEASYINGVALPIDGGSLKGVF